MFLPLVFIPSLSSEDMALNAQHDLTIPYNVARHSCFSFEYLIEDASVFEIKVLRGNTLIITISSTGKD